MALHHSKDDFSAVVYDRDSTIIGDYLFVDARSTLADIAEIVLRDYPNAACVVISLPVRSNLIVPIK